MRTRLVHLLGTIRANCVSFCSVALFVALGAGLLLGVGWSAVSLKCACDEAYTAGAVHDIEIQFPAGLTDEDLAAVRAVGGITAAEGRYATHVVLAKGNDAYTARVVSLGRDVDVVRLVEGTLPGRAGEVALQRALAERSGIGVGDRLVPRGTSAEGDASLSSLEVAEPRVLGEELVVCGLVDAPEYLSNAGSMIGVSSIGVGTVDFVGYVVPEAFDPSTCGVYTDIVATIAKPAGLTSFGDAYETQATHVLDALEPIAAIRAHERLETLHDEAEGQLADLEATLAEGREQLEEGKTRLGEGQQRLEEAEDALIFGHAELEAGAAELERIRIEGEAALDEARAQIESGQAAYDERKAELDAAEKTLADAERGFSKIQVTYDAAIGAFRVLEDRLSSLSAQLEDVSQKLDAYEAAQEASEEADEAIDTTITISHNPTPASEAAGRWTEFCDAYVRLTGSYAAAKSETDKNAGQLKSVAQELGMDVDLPEMASVPTSVTQEDARETVALARAGVAALSSFCDAVNALTGTVSGVTVHLTDVRGGFATAHDEISDGRAELAADDEKLRSQRQEFDTKKTELVKTVNEGREKLRTSERELEEGALGITQGTNELKTDKGELTRAEEELQSGESTLASARDRLGTLDGLSWVVTTRTALGAWRGPSILVEMMGGVRWAMVSIVVVVGLFVCYSAVSRIAYAEAAHIGALGFHRRRIARLSLSFAGMAVLTGMVFAIPVATLVVEGNVNSVVSRQFSMGEVEVYVSPVDLVAMSAFELVSITGMAWLAARSLTRLDARELFAVDARGEATGTLAPATLVARHIRWVRTNAPNVVGDIRRTVVTFVGVCGCTALIVSAFTLDADVAATPVRHYDEVYSFDAEVLLDEASEEAAGAVRERLEQRLLHAAEVYVRQMMVTPPDGSVSFATVVVPVDEEAFFSLYHLRWRGHELSWADGLWVSAAFSDHRGWGAGDTLTLTAADGTTGTFTIAGAFDYYLPRQEFVVERDAWCAATGDTLRPNALLVDTAGTDQESLRADLAGVEGFLRLVDDRSEAVYGFGEVSGLLKVVVVVHLVLAALTAATVLSNLGVVYVGQRRRDSLDLKVLGSTDKDAKASIWRDSVVPTMVGVALGVACGYAAGVFTIRALEPVGGHFVCDVSWPYAGAGTLMAVAFVTMAHLVALRHHSHFDPRDVSHD